MLLHQQMAALVFRPKVLEAEWPGSMTLGIVKLLLGPLWPESEVRSRWHPN